MQLADKCCLITGGTRGIGAATAIALAEHGADVALVGRDIADPEAVERTTHRGAESPLRFDRGRYGLAADATRCVGEASERLGPVHVLVHSAAGWFPAGCST